MSRCIRNYEIRNNYYWTITPTLANVRQLSSKCHHIAYLFLFISLSVLVQSPAYASFVAGIMTIGFVYNDYKLISTTESLLYAPPQYAILLYIVFIGLRIHFRLRIMDGLAP